MLTISNFYSYRLEKCIEDETYLVRIEFNKQHPIFNGHFPNNPVVPGVTLVQIVKEQIEVILVRKIRLEKISIIKFLKVIDPRLEITYTLKINLKILESSVLCDAQIGAEDTTYFKMKSAYFFV